MSLMHPTVSGAGVVPAARTQAPRYDPAQAYDVRVFDVEYRRADGESWLARIYQPQGSGPFPALLDVHGGVWSSGSRENNALVDRALAAAGLVVAAVDFRLGPVHPYPASIVDVNYATRWLKAHAPELNADPAGLGGLGSSSGGHMVMLSALRPDDPSYTLLPLPDAPSADATLAYVVLLWPVIDPYARYRFAQENGRTDLVTRTEGYFRTVEAMQEGNPQRLLERGEATSLPPALLIQGTADANLTTAMAETFTATYRAAGATIDLELFDGQPHGFASSPGSASDRALALAKSFIARQRGGS
jgi:acetyl esterase/lipase